MALIDWADKYSVGIPSIDEQHKIWIGLINKMHDAMRTGQAKNVLSDIFAEVVNYTKNHLANEEKLFAQYNYPDTVGHKAIHNKLTAQVVEYQKDFDEGKTVMSIDVMNFLKNWLVDHITNTDKKYSEFFISKGVK